MATLNDLSKEQLIELFDLSSKLIKKRSAVIRAITTQMRTNPHSPNSQINLPVQFMPKEQQMKEYENRRKEMNKADESDNPQLLYQAMKNKLTKDLESYSMYEEYSQGHTR